MIKEIESDLFLEMIPEEFIQAYESSKNFTGVKYYGIYEEGVCKSVFIIRELNPFTISVYFAYVLPEYRGNKILKEIIIFFSDKSIEAKSFKNRSSRKFIRSYGFKRIGKNRFLLDRN